MKKELIEKLNDKSAVIGIVGLGYVGLPLMLRYIEVGYKVLGFDIDEAKVSMLNGGKTYIGHIPDEKIASAVERGFEATADFERAKEADSLILCVPTPLDEHLEPDLSYVLGTTEMLLPNMRPGQVVSLESTTYPGTTDEELMPRIESTGLKVGESAFLVYSPEREDPGNHDFCTRTIPKVCGGVTPACREVGQALYGQVIDRVVLVSSTRAAEMVKLLENIHRAVNIGLVNEMKIVADRMGIDIFEVVEAAATKPFGFVPYYPGPGLGGHCIPIDPFYLTWKAKEYGIRTHFIELAGEINSSMPSYVVSRTVDALNSRKKALNGSRVLILGMAYKKDVDDSRESPSAELLALLHEKGAYIDYSDPHIAEFPEKRDYAFDLSSVELSAENIRSYDCLILATNHSAFDYELIKSNAALIVDTRGVYKEDKIQIFRA